MRFRGRPQGGSLTLKQYASAGGAGTIKDAYGPGGQPTVGSVGSSSLNVTDTSGAYLVSATSSGGCGSGSRTVFGIGGAGGTGLSSLILSGTGAVQGTVTAGGGYGGGGPAEGGVDRAGDRAPPDLFDRFGYDTFWRSSDVLARGVTLIHMDR